MQDPHCLDPYHILLVVVVQSLIPNLLFATPWIVACQASLSFTISWNLLKFMSIELMIPSNYFILPSIFPSIRVFSNESALCISWPKYWSFRFSISPTNEYLGLISFRIDWFDFAVHRTFKSLLQLHSSKASVLLKLIMNQCSAFYVVQLYNHTWLLEKMYLWLHGPLLAKINVSAF